MRINLPQTGKVLLNLTQNRYFNTIWWILLHILEGNRKILGVNRGQTATHGAAWKKSPPTTSHNPLVSSPVIGSRLDATSDKTISSYRTVDKNLIPSKDEIFYSIRLDLLLIDN